MTVMLLQRFSAPQSTLAQKKIQNYCDKEIGSSGHTGQQPHYRHCSENKYQNIQETSKNYQEHKDKLATNTLNNINANVNHNNHNNNINRDYNSNINNNNNKNNNNNNNINKNVKNTENCCKKEKVCYTSSLCSYNRALANSNSNNCNNNRNDNCNISNNNNINNNNNSYNGEEEIEEDNFLTRDKQNIRQETVTSRTTTITEGTTGTFGTSASQSRYYNQGVAMRYYRLWIYACNVVLLGSALGLAFALLRSLVFTRDPRRYLVPGVPRVLDPTALYAYLALATQLGLVQLLGCIAARRLSAKLLNAYWVLLLALLFGDAIIGVAWVFKFERIRAELRQTLRLKLQLDYGNDLKFSDDWDRLQRDFSCCGVTGPNDYSTHNYPETCCPIDMKYQSANHNETNAGCHHPYLHGCEENLILWMRKTADLLFVIGFCVMAFSKLCFLGILRYEIREMIQKIQLLKDPPPPASATFIQSFCQPPQAAQSTIQTAVTSSCGLSMGTATATITSSDTTVHSHINYSGTRRTTLPIVVSSSIVNNNPSGLGRTHFIPVTTSACCTTYSSTKLTTPQIIPRHSNNKSLTLRA